MEYDNEFKQIALYVEWARKHNKPRAALRHIRTIITQALAPPPTDFDGKWLLEKFLKGRSTTLNKHNLLSGASLLRDGMVYFAMDAWVKWLALNRIYPGNNRPLSNCIRSLGGERKFLHFSGTGEDDADEGRSLWYVPITSLSEGTLQPADDAHEDSRLFYIKRGMLPPKK